jgi:hypothetical protein
MATKKNTKKTTTSKPHVVAKSKVSGRKSKLPVKSFQRVKEQSVFMSYQITQQTIFWGILFIYIMILSLWILNIQLDTLRIIDRINSL